MNKKLEARCEELDHYDSILFRKGFRAAHDEIMPIINILMDICEYSAFEENKLNLAGGYGYNDKFKKTYYKVREILGEE